MGSADSNSERGGGEEGERASEESESVYGAGVEILDTLTYTRGCPHSRYSCGCDTHTQRLRQSDEVTKVKTIREEYARRLRGQYSHINARIREDIGRNDKLGLTHEEVGSPASASHKRDRQPLNTEAEKEREKHEAALRSNEGRNLDDVPEIPEFEFATREEKTQQFNEWFDEASDVTVLDTIDHNENRFARASYSRGISETNEKLRAAGFAVPETEIGRVLDMPHHKDTLGALYARDFQLLEGINEEVGRQLSRELTQALDDGINPTETAKRLTDRVDSVGKHRATLMARTETMNAHHTASMNRYADSGIQEVEILLNTTACEVCQDLADEGPFRVSESSGLLPVHPNCRCTTIPVLDQDPLDMDDVVLEPADPSIDGEEDFPFDSVQEIYDSDLPAAEKKSTMADLLENEVDGVTVHTSDDVTTEDMRMITEELVDINARTDGDLEGLEDIYTYFPSAESEKYPEAGGLYSFDNKKLLLNNEKLRDKSAWESSGRVGFLTGDSPQHAIRHEVGHHMHNKSLQRKYDNIKITKKQYGEALSGSVRDEATVARDVSIYGSSNNGELVAEVYAGKLAGKEFPDHIMEQYWELYGPPLP